MDKVVKLESTVFNVDFAVVKSESNSSNLPLIVVVLDFKSVMSSSNPSTFESRLVKLESKVVNVDFAVVKSLSKVLTRVFKPLTLLSKSDTSLLKLLTLVFNPPTLTFKPSTSLSN